MEDLFIVEVAFVVGVVLGVISVGYGDTRTLFGIAFILGIAVGATIRNLLKYLKR
jgi:hypothetical protein